MKYKLSLVFIILFANISISQLLFYQNICHCGVTGAGFSTGMGSGSGAFQIHIEPGSTIKKAFLFIQRFGNAKPTNIIINGNKYNFNYNNQVSQNYILPYTDSLSAIHAIDITQNLQPSQTNYNITIPYQSNNSINVVYGNVYLYVIYEKPGIPVTATSIFLNNYDMIHYTENYSVQNLPPINTVKPVGFAVYTDRMNNIPQQQDGSKIYVENPLCI